MEFNHNPLHVTLKNNIPNQVTFFKTIEKEKEFEFSFYGFNLLRFKIRYFIQDTISDSLQLKYHTL